MNLDAFGPSSDGPTALFLDTSGLFPYFHPETREHETVTAFLTAVGSNELAYRPLYTSTYVLDELATLLLSKGTHAIAETALHRTLDSEHISVLRETNDAFTAARKQFEQYSDHTISFTDQLSAVQMREHGIDHVLAYDGDFRTLGFEQIPRH